MSKLASRDLPEPEAPMSDSSTPLPPSATELANTITLSDQSVWRRVSGTVWEYWTPPADRGGRDDITGFWTCDNIYDPVGTRWLTASDHRAIADVLEPRRVPVSEPAKNAEPWKHDAVLAHMIDCGMIQGSREGSENILAQQARYAFDENALLAMLRRVVEVAGGVPVSETPPSSNLWQEPTNEAEARRTEEAARNCRVVFARERENAEAARTKSPRPNLDGTASATNAVPAHEVTVSETPTAPIYGFALVKPKGGAKVFRAEDYSEGIGGAHIHASLIHKENPECRLIALVEAGAVSEPSPSRTREQP